MNRFTTIALVALLAIAALIVPAAAQMDAIEVRSQVYTGAEAAGGISITPSEFAGFFYDIDDNIGAEMLNVTTDGANDRTIGDKNLDYVTYIEQVNYSETGFDNEPDNTDANTTSSYPVIGLFAEKYVALADNTPDELAKLLLDSDDKYTLRTGSALELPNGYELTAKQIDVEGDKVWMEFSKDGEFIDDEVISMPSDGSSATWTYDRDVGDTDDVIVFRARITDVFQGQVDSLAVVEGLYLIDYEDVLSLENGDEFGELEITGFADNGIQMDNGDNSITLSRDDTVDIAEGMQFRVADTPDTEIRFYLMKEYTEPGTYEIRGSIAEGSGMYEWNATNFAGFFYDIDDNIGSEELLITDMTDNTINDEGLEYNTYIEQVNYSETSFADEPDNTDANTTSSYPVMGFFAEKYVALADNTPDELAKLLLDNDDKYTLRTGSALELPNGFELTAKQIDVEGDKVWMELTKDGEFVEDEVITMSTTGDGSETWTYDTDVGDTDDVIVFRVRVTDVFQGQVDSLAVVEGLYLIDYEDVLSIDNGDEFGEMEVTGFADNGIQMNNGDNSITLSRDDTVDIAEDMQFRVADSSDLRFYPFVEWTIAGEETTQPDDEGDMDDEGEQETDNQTDGNETVEPPVDTPDEPEEPPVDEGNETTNEGPVPGFEAVFAVAGLLAVAYLVRRN